MLWLALLHAAGENVPIELHRQMGESVVRTGRYRDQKMVSSDHASLYPEVSHRHDPTSLLPRCTLMGSMGPEPLLRPDRAMDTISLFELQICLCCQPMKVSVDRERLRIRRIALKLFSIHTEGGVRTVDLECSA